MKRKSLITEFLINNSQRNVCEAWFWMRREKENLSLFLKSYNKMVLGNSQNFEDCFRGRWKSFAYLVPVFWKKKRMCHANSILWRERSLTMTELSLFANNGKILLWLLENSLITQHWALRSLARVVPPQKWSPPSKWSPPPKWPPITTEMIPAVTTEMIPGISGMELRGLQKLDNNLVRAFYLFILHLFYGV